MIHTQKQFQMFCCERQWYGMNILLARDIDLWLGAGYHMFSLYWLAQNTRGRKIDSKAFSARTVGVMHRRASFKTKCSLKCFENIWICTCIIHFIYNKKGAVIWNPFARISSDNIMTVTLTHSIYAIWIIIHKRYFQQSTLLTCRGKVTKIPEFAR